jgi:hypothetical protein
MQRTQAPWSHTSSKQLDPTRSAPLDVGFPADVMREASVVGGVYGAQRPDIDDPRAEAVRLTVTGRPPASYV